MSSNPHTTSDHDSSTISQISRGIRFAISLFSIAAGLHCARVVWLAPKLRVLYEELLGPDKPLPSVSSFLLRHHVGFIIATAALSITSAILAYRVRQIFPVIVIGAISIFLLVALGVLASSAIMRPMQQIIQAMAQ